MKVDEIKCPKCGLAYDVSDGYGGLVTYWGETGYSIELWCECDHKFKVQEYVERTYEYVEVEATQKTVTDDAKD